MSDRPPEEQSPWGTPPRPGPPPPGAPVPTGPTGPPVWGTPLPPPGRPPGRRTGLVVGLVAGLVIVVVAAVVATILVAGTGDDSSERAGDSGSASASDAPSTDADPADPADDDDVTGDGYRYRLPGTGWQDATEDADELGPGIDSLAILGSSFEVAQANILVEALPAPEGVDVEDLRGVFERNLSSTDGAETEAVDDVTIDGERAIGYRLERESDTGIPLAQIGYLTVHDGQQFAIGLTYPASGDAVSEADFADALTSWRWD